MFRTHKCNELTLSNKWEKVTLSGWVNSTRDHWWVIFIDLRDRFWLTQIKADPATCNDSLIELAKSCKSEFVIKITWTVEARPEWTINSDLNSWEIEVIPTEIIILSEAEHPPFEVADEHHVREEVRMNYRYIDLRRKSMKDNIVARHDLTLYILDYLRANDFLYIETPQLIKNTPEWAREYIVPSRNSPWKAYVLPQSPQQLKQLLMVSWFDRYCQIAKCFRDEDLRWDRQPEFTQFDMELSFVEQNDIINLIEKLFDWINKDLYSSRPTMANPFPVLTYDYAMNTFGIDKPELRTEELKLIDVSEVCIQSDLKLFIDIINNWWVVKWLVADKIYTRWVIDKFTAKLQEKWAKWLAYIIWDEEGPKSPILKFFNEDLQKKLLDKLWAKKWTTCFFQATDLHSSNEYLWYLRNLLIEDMDLTKENENKLAYAWVVDFPMFEIDEEWNFAAKHHPFTKPKDEFLPLIHQKAEKLRSWEKLSDSDLKELMWVRADAYDLVLNGNEVAWWSIRIYDKNLQRDIFTLLWLSQQQIDERFWHIIKAFQYWVPPHGWIAIWFDRLLMVLRKSSSIREVMPFPKTQRWEDLMLKAPSEIEEKLLKEIWFKIITE